MNNDRYLRAATLAGRLRQRVCLAVTQPMTATQLSGRLDRSLARCSKALLGLKSHKLMKCLNPAALRNRLFWLTPLGKRLRRHLDNQASSSYDFPHIDWKLYAKVCFSQRSQVIRTLAFPMRPSEIKRRAARLFPGCRMSANNVRDVIRYLTTRGVTCPVKLRKRKYPKYRLTEIGLRMRRLLLRVCRFSRNRLVTKPLSGFESPMSGRFSNAH
jgi:hypothetical protein